MDVPSNIINTSNQNQKKCSGVESLSKLAKNAESPVEKVFEKLKGKSKIIKSLQDKVGYLKKKHTRTEIENKQLKRENEELKLKIEDLEQKLASVDKDLDFGKRRKNFSKLTDLKQQQKIVCRIKNYLGSENEKFNSDDIDALVGKLIVSGGKKQIVSRIHKVLQIPKVAQFYSEEVNCW
eukprot:CAMPEP_0117774548 /NCGR_PEP_ID=MMETSP0947-20121206/26586_1 /TAXON_ID=44440 /ORGANISM="Chattonella subsalsa, Strain CCMP2191" /LENGTH=179 /DNA_ID=CAMNT_0005601041 /DNA_START=240 /DNA_END=776 /DNA_ORIENTATION=+